MPKLFGSSGFRGTRGKDESRSSVKEVLTSKPRAVIKPDFFNLSMESGSPTAYHTDLIRITDPAGGEMTVELNRSSTSSTGEKDAGNNNYITAGLSGLSTASTIADQITLTIANAIHRRYLSYLTVTNRLELIIIITTSPYIGPADNPPYTNYGSYSITCTQTGADIIVTPFLTPPPSDETIQAPFSLGSKILRGAP